ncbi:MAG TPA: hypothetical protein VI755_03280 [Anaerolineales bacterium]|nr:hypothetical protein [Anaerolineales bacterium]
MPTFPVPPHNTRLGFHYFPDTNHFRETDLRLWLPRLRSLGATWLTLVAPSSRAIPELFLDGLLSEGIEPILHFPFSLDSSPPAQELQSLLSIYSRWGIHYVIFFNRPNSRAAWSTTAWTQNDLVERFLDRFLPLAGAASAEGLVPVFPPLTPGGDYWDTSFLRAALQAIDRRGHDQLLESLVLSAFAHAGDRPLNWGCGGPERWPAARPYFTPSGCQDQRGFCIYDWYIAISEAVIGRASPLLLLGLGCQRCNSISAGLVEDTYTRRILAMAQALAIPATSNGQDQIPAELLDPLPPQVLGGNYWLLAADSRSPYLSEAWFQPNGDHLPVLRAMRQLEIGLARARTISGQKPSSATQFPHPLSHYLLLPSYDWGVADWHINAARPFIKKYLPTVGFSLAEAALAARITVVGSPYDFPESVLDGLRAAGCCVERIGRDGMSIATQLADR